MLNEETSIRSYNLVVTGINAGKTKTYCGMEFVNGRHTIKGVPMKLEDLLRRMKRVYQIVEETDGPIETDAATVEDDVAEVQGELREEERYEVPPTDIKRSRKTGKRD